MVPEAKLIYKAKSMYEVVKARVRVGGDLTEAFM